MKILLSAIVIAFFLASASSAVGFANPNSRISPASILFFARHKTDTLAIRGIVKHFAASTALFTDTAVYLLTGGDFAMIVGVEVNIIGKMIIEDDLQKLAVARVQFDRE